jgi:hypothetical protein
MNVNTQLTLAEEYKNDNVVYAKANQESIPGDAGMTYHRINLMYRNSDGTVGEFIVPTEQLFSFGVSENTSPETKNVTGYSLPLCLLGRDNSTPEEQAFVDMINSLVEHTKKHLLTDEVKSSLEAWELEASDLKKLNPLYYKKVKGKVVEGTGPVLYAKLLIKKNKKTSEIAIRTVFYEEDVYDEDGEPKEIPAVDLIGGFCHAKAAIKFESIYSGSGKIRFQIKVLEADIHRIGQNKRRFLRTRRKVVEKVNMRATNAASALGGNVEKKEEEEDELNNSDDEKEEPLKKVSVLRVKKGKN